MPIANNKTGSTVTAGDHAEHHNALATAINVRMERLHIKDYGAVVDNSTDDSAAWAAALAALPSSGGEIVVPRGVTICNQRLDFSGRDNVRIVGEGTDGDYGGLGSTLLFGSGLTGTTPLINARETIGFEIEGVTILYGSSSFTGPVIDFRNVSGTGANDTRKGGLTRCLVSGQNGAWNSASCCVALNNAVDLTFDRATFKGAVFGVIGRENNTTDYSNGHRFLGCKFENNLTAHVKNAGESWTFVNPIIEYLQGGGAGFYTHDAGVHATDFTLISPWTGDVSATGIGAFMEWGGHGLVIIGGRIGVEFAGVKGIVFRDRAGTAVDNCAGICLLGTAGVGPGTPLIDWGTTGGHTGVFIRPGRLSGGMVLEAGNRPAGADVMATTGYLDGVVSSGQVVAHNGLPHQVQVTHVGGAPAIILGGDTYIRRLDVGIMGVEKAFQFGSTLAEASAPNDALFKSASTSKISYKDSTGGVSALESRGLKLPVRVVSLTNVTISGPGASIDGVTMAVGDRVLLVAQTTPAQNGVYVWNGAAVAMTRSLDADTAAKLTDSLLVTVDEGTIGRDNIWTLSTNKPITVGTTALYFTRVYPSYATDAVNASSPYTASAAFIPTNAKIENPARHLVPLTNMASSLTSGTIRVSPLGVLRAGESLSSITFFSGTTAAATVTNQWAGICRLSDRQVLAVSPTGGAAAWAANSAKTFTFSSTFTAQKDELLLAFIMVQATTVPTLLGVAHGNAVTMGGPVICGNSNTSQTTPVAVGATLTAFTAITQNPYCYAT